MEKATLFKSLHSALVKRWLAAGDLSLGPARAFVYTISGSDFEPTVSFDCRPESSGRCTYSGNHGGSSKSGNYGRISKLSVHGVTYGRETFLWNEGPNSVIARSCVQYSTVSEQKIDHGGIIPIPLAQTGEGIADCELLRWYVQEGDEVDEFQPLCEVQSDKASVEITSRYKGKVTRILYTPGDIVKNLEGLYKNLDAVHRDLRVTLHASLPFNGPQNGLDSKASALDFESKELNLVYRSDGFSLLYTIKVGETLLELMVEGDQSLVTPVVGDEISGTELRAQGSSSSSDLAHKQKEIQATPAVRQLAKSYGIDLAAVSGTGRDGRILKEDVIKFVLYKEELNEEMRGISEASRGTKGTVLQSSSELSESSDSESDVEETELRARRVGSEKSVVEDHSQQYQIIPVRGFRRVMAKTMAAAVSVPHFHYTEEIEMNSIVHLKNTLKDIPSEKGVKVTYLPFLIKALSLALLKYPIMNSTVNKDVSEIHVHASHNIGIGMATSSGLVVPNIKHVERLSISQIAEELARLTQLAAGNKLSGEDVTGGTITVSNFGTIGGKYGSPILSVPEVAIVAIGKIHIQPRYNKHGILYPASIMGVTWGADHRVIDGATVASFCNEWKGLIEQPGLLLLNIR